MKRLRECGFDEIRAKKSLEENDGDVGASLESLLDEAFHLSTSPPPPPPAEIDREEIATLRQDEMMAVTSIYGDMFQEKIADKLWVMKLGLDHILKLVEGGSSDADKKRQIVDTRPICTFFAKGKCRYGKKCKLRHESPATKDAAASGGSALLPHELFEKALQIEEEHPFRLELRFPKDNAYPYQLPFISFSCVKGKWGRGLWMVILAKYLLVDYFICCYFFYLLMFSENFPVPLCLLITERLVEEARSLCECNMPITFSLIGMDRSEIRVRHDYRC